MKYLLLASALLAQQGEWVTREDTGAPICQLSRNLYRYEALHATGWCEHWTVPAPQPNMAISREMNSWIRCAPYLPAGCQLHFREGWR